MQTPTTKTLTLDWDGERNLEALPQRELTAGWMETNKVYDSLAGKVTFTFRRLFPADYEPPPDSGLPDDYYDDWTDNEQYFEYDGDAKTTWYKGQRIS